MGLVTMTIICTHEKHEKIELYIDDVSEKLKYSNTMSSGVFSLSSGLHHIRLVQFNLINHKTWPLYWLLPPIRFVGYAFFKTETTLYTSYDSNCASLDFDVYINNKDKPVILDFELKQLRSENNYMNQYFAFVEKKKIDIKNTVINKIDKNYLQRWRFIRLFPTVLFAVLFWAISFIRHFNTIDSYLIPGIYTVLVIINAAYILRVKSVYERGHNEK